MKTIKVVSKMVRVMSSLLKELLISLPDRTATDSTFPARPTAPTRGIKTPWTTTNLMGSNLFRVVEPADRNV